MRTLKSQRRPAVARNRGAATASAITHAITQRAATIRAIAARAALAYAPAAAQQVGRATVSVILLATMRTKARFSKRLFVFFTLF